MKRLLVGFVAAWSVLSAEQTAEACAGCSNPNLPGARAGNTALAPGELSVALNLTATTMRVIHSEGCPEIGPICNLRAEPSQLHDQRFYVGELRPILAFGITRVLGAELQMPVRLVSTTIVFRRLDGTAFDPDYLNIHHRNETLFGLADPWLLGRGTWTLDNFTMTGRAGFGLPLGSTEEDPFIRGRAGFSHQHIQLGTGTFYPVLAVDAGLGLGRAKVSGYAQTLLFLYENKHRYHAGNRFMAGLSGDYEIVNGLRLGLGGDILNEQPERWGGVVQQDGNVGRTDFLAGGTVSATFGTVTASLAVKVPVYQHFIGTSHDHGGDPGQLTYPAIINLAVQTTFGGEPPTPAITPQG